MAAYRRPGEEPRPEPKKVIEERYSFRGFWDKEPEGVCRVRYFDRGEQESPVLVISEVPENTSTNTSTSVTNLMEHLAPEIIRDICPERFEPLEPAVILEHYPELRSPRGRSIHPETWDCVSFER